MRKKKNISNRLKVLAVVAIVAHHILFIIAMMVLLGIYGFVMAMMLLIIGLCLWILFSDWVYKNVEGGNDD